MIALFAALLMPFAPAAPQQAEPPLALVGARVVLRPGDPPVEGATVLVRGGRIEAVGAGVELPWDARALDVTGLILAPALVDALQLRELSFAPRATQQGRPVDELRDTLPAMPEAERAGLAPERSAGSVLPQDAAEQPAQREAGFGAVLVAPRGELLSGGASWLSLSGRPPREALAGADVAQVGSLLWRTGPENYEGNRYPVTLMGVMAQLRQALLDAQREALLAERHARDVPPRRAPRDVVLEALVPIVDGRRPLVLVAQEEEDVRLALGLMDDFPALRVVVAGGREAFELAEELAERGVPVIHGLDFGKEPEDPDAEEKPGDARDGDEPASAEAEIEERRPWDVKDPLRQRRDRRERWLERVRGVETLRAAGVTVAFGSLERGTAKLLDGVRLAIEKGGLSRTAALHALTAAPADIFGEGAGAAGVAAGAPASLAAWNGDPLAEDSRVRLLVADGRLFDLRDTPVKEADEAKEEGGGEASEADDEDEGGDVAGEDESDDGPVAGAWPVEIDSDRVPSFRTGGDVLVRGATILTAGPQGTLSGADLLVRGGRIEAVGSGLQAPEGVRVVDGEGLFLAPGIIDCHAHVAIRGGINEWTRVVTPEVTIEDEVDADDVGIYRALAGGVTSARLLHGSANAIGGRHEVIKLRWGRPAPELRFDGAPRGVKFALGENPKRSNYSPGTRFPGTRMGVEAVLRRAFEAARRYRAEWEGFEAQRAEGRDPDPPRRDLRLEALAGILDGTIAVHSHCYRADEILMLLRVAEDYGFRVATLQHVLEGYKVAAEIAAHGAGGSTFVDWWGYKFEAYDATPYAAALMHEAGVLMSVNSDSDEHLRRLQLEAAKTVKYGGVPEEEALRMVTINPAIQLGIDGRTGSLEPGKDADFALYSHHPLDVRTRCLMTFVDGELYFERSDAAWNEWMAALAGRAGEAGEPAPAWKDPAPEVARELPPEALAALPRPAGATRATSTPPRPAGPALALVGGTVHTMEASPDGLVVHEPGVVLVEDGLLKGVYAGSDPPPPGFRVVDVSGLHVWPGLVDAGSSVGLQEIDSVRGTMDVSELGGDQPDLRAAAAYHADAEAVAVTRANGITTVLAVPQGAGVLGQSSAMALEGWTAAEALVSDPVALHLVAPRTEREAPDEVEGDEASSEAKPEGTLDERIERAWSGLREMFRAAREHARVAAVARERGEAGPPPDPRLAALAPYALGEAPVVFHADRDDQIMDALRFAEREGLRPIIAGGQEAWHVAAELARARVPVLVGPVLTLPLDRDAPHDAPYRNAAVLHAAGVTIAFRSNESASARDLPYHAGMAVAHGLPEDAALRALTLGAAEILGLSERLGSLTAGKRADLIVTDGSPLQIRTQLRHLVIGGRLVDVATRHTELYERYRARLLDPAVPSR